jgi:hypothetical protein
MGVISSVTEFRHCPLRVDTVEEPREGALTGASARAGSVEGGEVAVRSAQVGVLHIIDVEVVTCDHTCWIDVGCKGAGRAGSVEGGDLAVRSAHEAVIHKARVGVKTRNCALWITAIGQCALGRRQCLRPKHRWW